MNVDPVSVGSHRPNIRGEVPLPRLWLERGSQMMRLYRNWPTALSDRLGFRRPQRKVLYRLNSSVGPVELLARTNGSDVRTINEIWIGELYDQLVPANPAPSRPIVIVDIGANCGYFAVYAGLKFPGARIVCFEPEEDNRTLARINLELNGVEADIRPQAVVASAVDTIELSLSDDPRLHTTVAPAAAAAHGLEASRYSGRTVQVPAIEINAALAPLTRHGGIDLLKMDVEGLELQLVEALDGPSLASVRCISAEVGDLDIGAARARLEENGFTVTHDAGLLLARRSREEQDGS